jgi:hypothetical protein
VLVPGRLPRSALGGRRPSHAGRRPPSPSPSPSSPRLPADRRGSWLRAGLRALGSSVNPQPRTAEPLHLLHSAAHSTRMRSTTYHAAPGGPAARGTRCTRHAENGVVWVWVWAWGAPGTGIGSGRAPPRAERKPPRAECAESRSRSRSREPVAVAGSPTVCLSPFRRPRAT